MDDENRTILTQNSWAILLRRQVTLSKRDLEVELLQTVEYDRD